MHLYQLFTAPAIAFENPLKTQVHDSHPIVYRNAIKSHNKVSQNLQEKINA